MTNQQISFFERMAAGFQTWAASSPLADDVKAVLGALAMAQSALETGWGESSLCALGISNFSGIKFWNRDLGPDHPAPTTEVINGQVQHVIGHFQCYSAGAAGWLQDYTRLLMARPCIVAAIPQGIEAVCEALGPWTDEDKALMKQGKPPKHSNYSSSPAYSDEVLTIIKQYRLTDPRALGWYASGSDPASKPVFE